MKKLTSNIKEIIEALKKSWKYRERITLLALLVALIVPVGYDIAVQFIPTSHASYQKEQPVLLEDVAQLVELREAKVREEMEDEVHIRAIKSVYDDLGLLTNEQLKKDYREALEELQ